MTQGNKLKSEIIQEIILNQIQFGIYLLDLDQNILFLNKKAEELTSVGQNNVIHKNIFEVLRFEDISGNPINSKNNFISKAIVTKKAISSIQLKYINPDSTDIWICASATPVKQEDNHFDHILMIFHEISDSFNISNALKESEKKYRNLTENSPDVIMRFDKDCRHLFVNQAVFKSVSIEPEKFLNKTHKEMGVFPDHLCDFWEGLIREVFITGSPKNVEFKVDGEKGKVYFEWRLFPEYNESGKVETVLTMARDITERIISEKKLKESRQMTSLILNNIPQSIFWKDLNSVYLGCNKTFAQLTGLNHPDDIIGKTDYDLPWKKEESDFFIECDQRVMRNNKAEFNIIEPGQLIDGSISWNDTNKIPLLDENEKVIGIIGTAENITEKMMAQKALKDNEERLRMALDATSEGIWDMEKDTGETYFSPRFFSMLGYDQADIKPTIASVYRLVHPDDYRRVRKQLEDFLDSAEDSIEYEMRYRKKDGSYAWILSRGKAFKKDKDGKPLRVVGTHVDISRRKKHENIQNALFGIANAVNTTRNIEELFSSIQITLGSVIDTTNCYIALYDEINDTLSLPFHKDEKDTFHSFPAGKTLTGYVIKTGKTLLADKKVADQLEKAGIIDTVGTPSESWLGVPLKHGEKIIGVFAVQSYSKDSVYTQSDVQILEFVSDQIALAIERKRDQDDILNNQIRQKRIIEASPDGLVVIDPDGVITEFNTSIVEMLKTAKDNLRERHFMDFVLSEDQSVASLALSRTKLSGYNKNIEFRMLTENGERFYAEASFGLINKHEELSESYVIIIKNIEERKAYELNLRVAKEKAEESGRLKTAFLSNMSHEIRTPMNAIIGFSELLSHKDIDESERREFLSQINTGAETLMHLIDDIIDIAKIESGQINIHKTRFLLSDIFNDLSLSFKKIIVRTGKDNLTLKYDNNGFSPDIVIFTDHFRLKQILTNLLSNAIKFTDTGMVCFGIKEIEGNFIHFYVKDTGIGIEKEKQHLIFERFRQGHDSKTKLYGGTGLGLTISRNLTELLGGIIYVNSEEGKGAEFGFSIPLELSDTPETTVTKEIPLINLILKGRTILVAEDEDSNYTFLAEALKRTEATLIRAKDGIEVVDLFISHPETDLVLMDIRLPFQSGYEATRIIKSVRKEVPVVAQTAYAMEGEKHQSILEGCDDFISKPIKISELYSVIGKYLKS